MSDDPVAAAGAGTGAASSDAAPVSAGGAGDHRAPAGVSRVGGADTGRAHNNRGSPARAAAAGGSGQGGGAAGSSAGSSDAAAGGEAGDVPGAPGGAAGGAAPAAGAAVAAAGPEPCPVAGCTVVLPDGVRTTWGYTHLARAHVVESADLTASQAAAYGVAGCR